MSMRRAGIGSELIELELCAQLDAVLLAAVFDDCVHGSPKARDEIGLLSLESWAQARQDGRVRREAEIYHEGSPGQSQRPVYQSGRSRRMFRL